MLFPLLFFFFAFPEGHYHIDNKWAFECKYVRGVSKITKNWTWENNAHMLRHIIFETYFEIKNLRSLTTHFIYYCYRFLQSLN